MCIECLLVLKDFKSCQLLVLTSWRYVNTEPAVCGHNENHDDKSAVEFLLSLNLSSE
jgi:hypothetical protein